MKKSEELSFPTVEQINAALQRENYRHRYARVLRSTVYLLVTVAAIAVLIATLWMPVLRIYGDSMTPTLYDGNIVISVKTSDFQPGDVVAFYYNNKILVKRVIATASEWVNINESGQVFVNDVALKEPYIQEKALGECNIEMPYQVPESRIFVMGDHRSVSVDSRSTSIGCIAEEHIVGKLVFCIWPLNSFGEIG